MRKRPAGSARLHAWLAVGGWASLISVFSTGWFSGEHTGAVLLPILHALLPGAAPEQLIVVHAIVRKAAHVCEYLILGVLLVRALHEEGLEGVPLVATAVGIGVAYAMLDEVHQAFVPTRTASPRDVAVDATGLVAGVGVAIAWLGGALSSPVQN